MEGSGEQTEFTPFSKAERMQQLDEIDRNCGVLLRSARRAVDTLTKLRVQGEDDIMAEDKDQLSQVFKDSTNEFLRTLRTVNVGMKRQIWGLEEAYIISSDKEAQSIRDEGGEGQGVGRRNAPLKPDGAGKIGGLDVGWLNSRSDKVERDMEADLWNEAESFLRRLLQAGGASQTTDGESQA
ncbi:mediator complex, subunit Med11 [Hypoxylon sp. FL0543]|nr:mediator complex, subunit Med11 [Hypoxylon sp. FL0543]